MVCNSLCWEHLISKYLALRNFRQNFRLSFPDKHLDNISLNVVVL